MADVAEVKRLVEKSGLTPEEITTLVVLALTHGLAFVLEEVAGREMDKDALANRAEELFAGTADRLAERRKLVEAE